MDRAAKHEHGGGLDAAMARYGGQRADWLDLSTGINPEPYPIGDLPAHAWSALPGSAAYDRLITAARRFWDVPNGAVIVPAAGASAIIAKMPALADCESVYIPTPTYNEHAAAFAAHGVSVEARDNGQSAHVYVHPNNPDGRLWPGAALHGRDLTVIDESFCDVIPDASHIALTNRPGVVVLKSFGKFWGLAGLRLGFAIGHPDTLNATGSAAPSLEDHLGPWAVSGPALDIGARALEDTAWAEATRARLEADATRLDTLMAQAGARVCGGTNLFRLYEVWSASKVQHALCKERVLSRSFSYSKTWIRLGLPPRDHWDRLEEAVAAAGEAISGSEISAAE